MKLVTRANKPKRIITMTARLKKIRVPTQLTGLEPAEKIVNKRTHATAAAHSLRNRARKRNRSNRHESQKPGARTNAFATLATIARAPRNTDCGPGDGCG